MALYRKAKTGEGCSIEIPMFENLVKFVLEEHMYLKTFDPPLGETGDPRLLDPLGKPIPTKDSYICISANTNDQAFGFFDVIGRPELKSDPRFSSVQARFANVAAYFEVRMAALKSKTTAEWLELFDAADVPAMPYHTLESVMEDPHLVDAGFFKTKTHQSEGEIREMRLPNVWSCGTRKEWSGAPKLGQHSVEILREYGFEDAAIEQMIDLSATPIILSHHGADHLNEHPRNAPDALLKKMAAKGGVIHMNALGSFIKTLPQTKERTDAMTALRTKWGNPNQLESTRYELYLDELNAIDRQFPENRATLEDYMQQVLYTIKLVGVDHVGFGADWDGGGGLDGFRDITALPKITDRLLKEGYTEADLAKMWSGNVIRLLKAAEDYKASLK
jgi:hypothetical protein